MHALVPASVSVSMPALIDRFFLKAMQRVWRWQRSVTLGAQAIVIDAESRVLLIRHTYRPGWHFPGGGVERGETVRKALERELEEEAGIRLDDEPQFMGLFTNFERFPGDHVAVYVVHHWRQPTIPFPNREIAEQGFFAYEALPSDTSPGTRRRIEEVLRGLKPDTRW
jgi:8-oxo-dGTP pyrophosphatase MutT (NUDIX family)